MNIYINGVAYECTSGQHFQENLNEEYDTASAIIKSSTQLDLKPYDYVYCDINTTYYVIKSFVETLTNLSDPIYEYTIELESPTAILDTIQVPNLSIVAKSVNGVITHKKINDIISNWVDLYIPKVKFTEDGETWTYKKIIEYSSLEIFNVDCPDVRITAGTLKNALTTIMQNVGCIPKVVNRTLAYLNLTETTGIFNTTGVNYITRSGDATSYVNTIKTDIQNGINEHPNKVEIIGFRDRDNSLVSESENLFLTTRFPIYKVKKLIMYVPCDFEESYRVFHTYAPNGELVNTQQVLTIDITKLVMERQKRSRLNVDFREMTSANITDMDDLAKYLAGTVEYSVGGNTISGFSSIINYQGILFDNTKIWIENIINIIIGFSNWYDYCEWKDETGVVREFYETYYPEQVISEIQDSLDKTKISVIGSSASSPRFKQITFSIEYDALINTSITHHKDNVDIPYSQIDNQQNSIVSIDSFLQAEQEKVNRLGNEVITINQRLERISGVYPRTQLNALGTIYGDYIIFSRTYEINDNYIVVSYNAMKSYVLKTYFTGLATKYRAFAISDYSSSIIRSDNKCYYVLIDNYYISDYEAVKFGDYQYSNLYEKAALMNGMDSAGGFIGGYKIKNTAYNINSGLYLEEANIIPLDDGLAFNMQCFDNASAGLYLPYVDNDYSFAERLKSFVGLSTTGKGTMQKWWVYKPSNEDLSGYADNCFVSFVGDLGISESVLNIAYKVASQKSNSTTNWNILPKISNTIYSELGTSGKNIPAISFCDIGVSRGGSLNPIKEERVYKDNEELLNRTYQFEYYTTNSRIKWTKWLFKLNSFVNVYSLSGRKYYQVVDNVETELSTSPFTWNLDKTRPSFTINYGSASKIIVKYNGELVIEFTKGTQTTETFYISINNNKTENVWSLGTTGWIKDKYKVKQNVSSKQVEEA